MKNKILSMKKKRLDTDISIILSITGVVFLLYIFFQGNITAYLKNTDYNLLIRTIMASALQFGIAGLGICIVIIFRKENFHGYGIKINNMFRAILLSIIPILPYILLKTINGEMSGYLPFKYVLHTREWIELGLPGNVVGFCIIGIVWGFFEPFNYVVICKKINERWSYPNLFLSLGPLLCGIFSLLIHGLFTINLENLFIFFIIYGMLVVSEKTKNAWGCILIFIFLWNAI
ncbi:hypothetical protein SH1V18_31580 [Vallitalea longa]|uniref:Uncharacterized protein n=1 Tax=Vallitalea longa TaxID=2936439 RepID=A0A9W6DGQ2_9FIRM|nr:hypothetical protein [Vallitalea longa]GKX30678.1 hypothetical protein SH1V18_31580 [Vallitalea longa]